MIGAALGFLDLRLPEVDWRTHHPNLVRLHDKLAQLGIGPLPAILEHGIDRVQRPRLIQNDLVLKQAGPVEDHPADQNPRGVTRCQGPPVHDSHTACGGRPPRR